MQQVKDTILKALALIENPEAWTQGASAQDSAGLPVPPESPQACRWCILGAIDKASNYDYNRWLEATRQIRDVLRGKATSISIAAFNDSHTHAEVLALLRKAAA
jgi:hypothetical protein